MALRSIRRMPVSPSKAGEILRHGEVHGKPLTKRQTGFFGLIRSGKVPQKTKRR